MSKTDRQGPSLISRQDKDLLDKVRAKAGAASPRSLAASAGISKGRATDIIEGRYPSRNLTEAFRRKLLDYLASEGSATVTVARGTTALSDVQKAAAYDLIADLVRLNALISGASDASAPSGDAEIDRLVALADLLRSRLDRSG